MKEQRLLRLHLEEKWRGRERLYHGVVEKFQEVTCSLPIIRFAEDLGFSAEQVAALDEDLRQTAEQCFLQ